ncbi:hypothetical protein DFH09DRAFT_1171581 [Mycena vulgaris]|nr:hypothetical protein DFH09DRAFT_1171581 [Mycena vulgaris]
MNLPPFLLNPAARVWTLRLLLVPAFAIYCILIRPLTSEIYTRTLAVGWVVMSFGGNAIVLIEPLDVGYLDIWGTISALEVHALTTGSAPGDFDRLVNISCPIVFEKSRAVAECPHEWSGIISVTISATMSPGPGGVYVRLLEGNLSPDRANLAISVDPSPPVPLLPGSHLFGVVSWTQREIFRRVPWRISNPLITLRTADISGLQQQIPMPRGTAESDAGSESTTASLTLHQYSRYAFPRNLLRDTAAVTFLSGTSTFVTLLLAANVICGWLSASR